MNIVFVFMMVMALLTTTTHAMTSDEKVVFAGEVAAALAKLNLNAGDGKDVQVLKTTRLHDAAAKGIDYACDLLVDNEKFDVNALDEQRNTPLHLAVLNDCVAKQHDYRRTYKSLIDRKANVDACNEDGNTPLHLAAKNNHPNVCKLLLENKATVDVKNAQGHTPLCLASDQAVMLVLLEHGAKIKELQGFRKLTITVEPRVKVEEIPALEECDYVIDGYDIEFCYREAYDQLLKIKRHYVHRTWFSSGIYREKHKGYEDRFVRKCDNMVFTKKESIDDVACVMLQTLQCTDPKRLLSRLNGESLPWK